MGEAYRGGQGTAMLSGHGVCPHCHVFTYPETLQTLSF